MSTPFFSFYKTTLAVFSLCIALFALLGFGLLDQQHPSAQVYHFEKAQVLAVPYQETSDPTRPLVMNVVLRDGPQTAHIPLRMDPKPLENTNRVMVSYRLTYLTRQKIDVHVISNAS